MIREKYHPKKSVYHAILDIKYIPTRPFKNQLIFLSLDDTEAMYGGAAGGGKSEALLMGALYYVNDPNYHSLILRRTYKDLALPGALMDRSWEWLGETDAEWSSSDKTWVFPSGSTLTFGYLQHEKDKYQYQSSEFQYIAFDELTQFTESQYLYLFSRLRKNKNSKIPLRIRSATNPGGVGHEWVKERFITGSKPFIPARLEHNPYLLQEEYEKSLLNLDHITHRRLRFGDWDIYQSGGLFKREWFTDNIIDSIPDTTLYTCRAWDLAATTKDKSVDPDYTAGVLLAIDRSNIVYILDIIKFRGTPHQVEKKILETARLDGSDTMIIMEQEGGASGKIVIDDYSRKLAGYTFYGSTPNKNKVDRAKPVSSYAEHGNIRMLRGSWNHEFITEIVAFPNKDVHDDQVDALSHAFNTIIKRKQGRRHAKSKIGYWGMGKI